MSLEPPAPEADALSRFAHRTCVRCVHASSEGETGVRLRIFSGVRLFRITFCSPQFVGIFPENTKRGGSHFSWRGPPQMFPGEKAGLSGRREVLPSSRAMLR